MGRGHVRKPAHDHMADFSAKAVCSLYNPSLTKMRTTDTLCEQEKKCVAEIAFRGIGSDGAGKSDRIVADMNFERRAHRPGHGRNHIDVMPLQPGCGDD